MMKRITALLVAVLLLLTACDGASQGTVAENAAPTSTATTATIIHAIDDCLRMPKVMAIGAPLDESVVIIKRKSDNIIRYIYGGESTDVSVKEVVLTAEEITQLNRMYDAVTDFSEKHGWSYGRSVSIYHDDQIDSITLGGANQEELNEYIDTLYHLPNEEGRCVSITTIAPMEISPSSKLIFPDRIETDGCLSMEDYITIQAIDDETLQFIQGDGSEVTVRLSGEQIAELNALYTSITDFTNIVPFEEPDTRLYDGENCYEFCDASTSQVELAHFMGMLYCYCNGNTYDPTIEEYYRMFDEYFATER